MLQRRKKVAARAEWGITYAMQGHIADQTECSVNFICHALPSINTISVERAEGSDYVRETS